MSATSFRATSVVRVGVTVTFLRMDHAPDDSPPALPAGATVVRVAAPTVAFYRFLYNTVGAEYVWWLRRLMPDAELAALLRHPAVEIHVLYLDGQPAGFFELETRPTHETNLSYFGLMPHAVGTGIGTAFLRRAVAESWSRQPRGLTVNTCTADHPRALPAYLRAGFLPVRRTDEVWNVPLSLGLTIPPRLRR